MIRLSIDTDHSGVLELEEIKAMARLDRTTPYPLIVKYHEAFEHRKSMWLVLERLEGDVVHLLGKTPHFVDDFANQFVCLLQIEV